jgi:hypothetical protein
MHVRADVSAVFFVFLSVLMCLGAEGRVLADNPCIERPDRDAPVGEHWYYHSDREKNRRCWHLGPAVSVVREAPAPRPERAHTVASTLNSVFAPLVRGVRNLFRRPISHETVAGEPRIIQSDPTRPLTIEDIAQPLPDIPEERAEARPASSFTPAATMTAAQRKALFEAFQKWMDQRRAGSPLAVTVP